MACANDFSVFVGGLSDDEVRRELCRAYAQMERCMDVLRGCDVEPVEMLDNGESTDLELFYLCRKVAGELSYLNDVVSVAIDSEGGVCDGEEV